jgi:hypothetical protein
MHPADDVVIDQTVQQGAQRTPWEHDRVARKGGRQSVAHQSWT